MPDSYHQAPGMPAGYVEVDRGHSGYDNQISGRKQCRICLEEDGEEDMIAPCRCKGTSKWVHRACLDRWRYTKEDRAFSKCTECHFEYRMHVKPESKGLFSRRTRYTMAVTRDFMMILLATQFCICFLAWFIHGLDTAHCADGLPTTHSWGIGDSHTHPETCNESDVTKPGQLKPGQAPTRMICGELRKLTLCWIGIAPHDKTSYYIIGMVTFFAIVGFIGCCVGAAQGAEAACCDTCDTVDCYWCIWCDCNHNTTVTCSGCGNPNCNCGNCDCGNCDCGDCNCDGDAGAILAVIGVVICVVLAFVGLLMAVAFMAVMIQTIMQRHMHILKKKEYAQAFIVADLQGMNVDDFSRSYEPIEYSALFQQQSEVPEMPSQPPPAYSPMASAPPMNQKEMDELFKLGLM